MSAAIGNTAPTAEDSSVVRSAEVKASPVDVLAVMEREARVADAYRRESGADVLAADAAQEAAEARAAVAELIEGASAAHMALIGYLPAHRNAVTDAAIAKVSAALARVGGAA